MNKVWMMIVVLCVTFLGLQAQSVYPSMTFVQTSYNNHQCFANDNASQLFFNDESKELYLVVDFAKVKVGHDTIDAWLDDLDDGKLYFKTIIASDKLLLLTNNNTKTLKVNGKIRLNEVVNDVTISITFFEISKEGMLYRNTGNDYYDRIRTTFQLEILPKDFKLDKKLHHLKKPITISIGSGYINQLKPGLESWIEKF